MENLKPKRTVLSFEDFVSQGLDMQPAADANIEFDQPHDQMHNEPANLPVPAQHPMGQEEPNDANLVMMDEPAQTQTEIDTDSTGDNNEPTEEEPANTDFDSQN